MANYLFAFFSTSSSSSSSIWLSLSNCFCCVSWWRQKCQHAGPEERANESLGWLRQAISLFSSPSSPPSLHPFLSDLLNNISISIQLTHIFRYLSLLLFLFWPFFGHILAISGRCSLCDANYEYLRADFDKLLCLLFAQNCCIMCACSPSLYHSPSSAADLATFSPPACSVTLLSCRAWKRGKSRGRGVLMAASSVSKLATSHTHHQQVASKSLVDGQWPLPACCTRCTLRMRNGCLAPLHYNFWSAPAD